MNKKYHTVYISLGSNLGDKAGNIRRAISILKRRKVIRLLKKSSFYITEPCGIKNQPRFVNAVIKGRTILSPGGLLKELKRIEVETGRIFLVRWGPRIIDMDILLYDNKKINLPDLKIPHPLMFKRKFVMKPLLEIEPDKRVIKLKVESYKVKKLP